MMSDSDEAITNVIPGMRCDCIEETVKLVQTLYGSDTAENFKIKIRETCTRNRWRFCDIDARFFELTLNGTGKENSLDQIINHWEIFGKVIAEYDLY